MSPIKTCVFFFLCSMCNLDFNFFLNFGFLDMHACVNKSGFCCDGHRIYQLYHMLCLICASGLS